MEIQKIIKENDRRNEAIRAPFNPITGRGSLGKRKRVEIPDFPIPVQYLPVEMLKIPLIKQIIQYGGIDGFLESLDVSDEDYEAARLKTIEQFVRLRCRYDFAFWAAFYVYIKAKGGGADILFRLNRPQRRLIESFEEDRKANKPIRVIVLKARQWGGSTGTQVYMAWLQLVHRIGLNSLIVGHVLAAAYEVRDMFNKMIAEYPVEMLHKLGETYSENEPKIVGVGNGGNIHRIPQRNCKIKIGTAEKPDSARGGDYNLVHLTEVGLWKKTEGRNPKDIVRSACSGILYRPYTMIVYESTANGTGNFFYDEYQAAKDGSSQFKPLFISWYEIEQYSLAIDDVKAFATNLYKNRENSNVNNKREDSGKYLWWLWEQGATLEAINWYIQERAKYNDHGDMASEYPSDDIEAFVHSGAKVFDKYKVENLRKGCRPPKEIGDLIGKERKGENALKDIRFVQDNKGELWIWRHPEKDPEERVTNRYLVIVDIGGRSSKADYSVILVLDRLFMIDGGKPSVVAQWYGHIDMDILAWKSAQIAAYYDNALLVIESNTLETHDRDRNVEGDQSGYILNQISGVYDNLYARKQSEDEIIERAPKKYGFHTNVATKPMIISNLIEIVREGMYTERDERCLDEYLTYEKKQNGSYGAIIGKHDDILMTRAIGLHICYNEMELPRIVKLQSIKTKQKAKSVATF